MRPSLLLVTASALLLLPSACTSSSGSTGPTSARTAVTSTGETAAAAGGGSPTAAGSGGGCRPDITAEVCVTVAITGAAAVSGTARITAPEPPGSGIDATCSQLATATDNGARDMGDSIPGGIGGKLVGWDISFAHYSGPGTYSIADAEFDVTIDTVGYNHPAGATGSIKVGPDFATTMTFDHLTSSSSSGAISGTISWTCVDPS